MDAQIDTTQTFDENYVRSETTISVGGDRVANGIAEEDRRFGMVNKTSAAENCETSAIGRALSNRELNKVLTIARRIQHVGGVVHHIPVGQANRP